MSDISDRVIYPMMDWSISVGETKVCLVEIEFARNLKEAKAGANGGALPGVPLGMTANQCRELAADLLDAAKRLDKTSHCGSRPH
jgi:hypothetical protein